MTNSSRRILVLGTHGQYNIGDELLLFTFLRQFGAENKYVVNTYDAVDTAARIDSKYRVQLINTAGDRFALLRHIRRADALVFAGGSILKELSAATGRNRYSTLVMILAIVTTARWVMRTPMAMLNIGVGPIRTATGRRLAGRILAQVGLVSVRDATSAALCEQIGVRRFVMSGTDAVFSADAAWLLQREPGVSRAESRTEDEPIRIALSLNHDIDVPENWENVLESLAGALRSLAAERAIEIHALPMQSRGKVHDDATVLRDFATRIPEVTVIEHELNDHHDVARVIAECDLVVGERLHALITSAVLGVAIVPLAYDVKVRALATSLGLDNVTIDLSSRIDASQVRTAIDIVLADPKAARARLAVRTAALSAQAHEGFDRARAWLDNLKG